MNATVKPKGYHSDLDAMMDRPMNSVKRFDFIQSSSWPLYAGASKSARSRNTMPRMKQNKTIKAQRICLTYTVEETINHDQNEQPVANGTMFSQTFNGYRTRIEFFRKAASTVLGIEDFEKHLSGDVIQGVMAADPFCAKISIQTSKGEGNKVYENLRDLSCQCPEK